MKFEIKTLDKDAFYKKVEQFKSCINIDIKKFILDSEIVYSSTYDFMFKSISISIIQNNNILYLLHDIDGDKWIEPLLIQIDDKGNLLDAFLGDFINNYNGSLDDYYINCIEFSRLLEESRSPN